MTPTTARDRSSERGVALIWFALFMMMFLGFIALGIDMAKLAATRTQLQNAADAGALAAASAVDPTTGQLVQDIAVARAQQTAIQNAAFIDDPQPVAVEAGDVVFLSGDRVQVTARRTGDQSMVTQMAVVLGLPRLSISATAVAKVDTASGIQCIAPIGVTLRPGETFSPGCGNLYTLKQSSETGGSRGNYGYLALPNCPSSPCHQPSTNPHQIACLIANGWCCGVDVGETIPTATGNKGPAIDGIKELFLADTDRRENICYASYVGNGKRLITVPIVTPFPAGSSAPVTVLGFATFFLRKQTSIADGTITGEFVYASAAGLPGGRNSSGGVTFVVRLVR